MRCEAELPIARRRVSDGPTLVKYPQCSIALPISGRLAVRGCEIHRKERGLIVHAEVTGVNDAALPPDDREKGQEVAAVLPAGAGISIIYVLWQISLFVYVMGRGYEYAWFVEATRDLLSRSRK